MYTFFKSALSPRNLFDLLLNVSNFVFLAMILQPFFPNEPKTYFGIAGGIWLGFLMLASTPFMEGVFRAKEAKKLRKVENTAYCARVKPLFDEVMSAARRAEPNLGVKIKLYIQEDDGINAFALGQRTLILTHGTIEQCSDEEIKAIMGHEFGHLAHRDSEMAFAYMVGIWPVMICYIICISLRNTILLQGSRSRDIDSIGYLLGGLMLYLMLELPLKIYQWILKLLSSLGSREKEYAADAFAVSIGYGEPFLSVLAKFKEHEYEGSFFDNMMSTHPSAEKREERVLKLLVL